jgi:gluconate 2-dehydrogenase alpha chain
MTIQDFGVSYEELELYFDYAEKVFGTSGQAWTVNGQVVGEGKGGNPYAPDRSNPFPLPSQKNVVSAQIFQKATTDLGYKPYNLPSANTSGPYTNPYGAQMGPCNFCGYCSGYACYMYSKACRTSSCARTLTCFASTSTTQSTRPRASPTSMRKVGKSNSLPTW